MNEFIKNLIDNSIRKLVKNDSFLLVHNASERSIAHRLALYIEEDEWIYANGYQVDCEYNRVGDGVLKKLHGLNIKYDEYGSLVYPDIIIHKRGQGPFSDLNHPCQNFLIIEIKKSTSEVGDSDDVKKIDAYIEELGYLNGLAVKIFTGKDYKLHINKYKVTYEKINNKFGN